MFAGEDGDQVRDMVQEYKEAELMRRESAVIMVEHVESFMRKRPDLKKLIATPLQVYKSVSNVKTSQKSNKPAEDKLMREKGFMLCINTNPNVQMPPTMITLKSNPTINESVLVGGALKQKFPPDSFVCIYQKPQSSDLHKQITVKCSEPDHPPSQPHYCEPLLRHRSTRSR